MVALLAALVLLPMFWLLVTSLRDASKAFTLDHYRHLFVGVHHSFFSWASHRVSSS